MSDARRPDRRTLLKGAAWSAPAIVVATAAPAMAASGPAMVTTRITPTMDDAGHNLFVSMQFDNVNTGGTGLTTIFVSLLPATGVVDPIPPTGVSNGWVAGPSTPTSVGNGRVFPFTSATGIPGAPPNGVAAAFLFFSVKVGPDSVLRSAGSIRTTSTTENGQILDGSSAWG